MTKLLALAALAALSCMKSAGNAESPPIVGKWSGRVERPGVESGRRMAQVGTAEFGADHRFVCRYPNPEQQEQREQGTWALTKGRLSIATSEVNGIKIKIETRSVEISHQPLELRLPVQSGAWFLVLRPVETAP